MNEKARRWAIQNPDKIRAHHRMYYYGIDAETVRAKLNAQDGKCKICMIADGTDVDHDHATGEPRGMLCGNCNRGLGLFRDDPERIQRAVMYLAVFGIPSVELDPNTGRRVDGKRD